MDRVRWTEKMEKNDIILNKLLLYVIITIVIATDSRSSSGAVVAVKVWHY